ncbi:MAG: hypothetical protein RIR51_761 [Bacteroidota bacterium]|jgi:hypothetical protein
MKKYVNKLKKIKEMRHFILKHYLIISIPILLFSCKDEFMELTPLGGATSGNYWQTAEDAVAYSNVLYYYMPNEEYFSRGFMWYINASDDMVTGRANANADAAVYFTLGGNESYYINSYEASYRTIGKANDILENVPGMDIDQNIKNRLLGEAYFMRAFSYFWVAHTYGDNGSNGGVPIVTVENKYDQTFTRPGSVIDNYQMIIEDLNKAAELLPLFTTYDESDKGRAHKDAALAYAAKTYMYWAQYDKSKWAKVIEYCDKVTNSGSGRGLLNTGNPDEDFANIFTESQDFGKEYIWSVISGTQSGSKLPGIMLENKGWGDYNGWGYYQPTLELYNEFEAGDARKKATILEFGQEFQWFGKTRRYSSSNSQTGFQFNKYMNAWGYDSPVGTTVNANGNNPSCVIDVPLLRYAEILLMKAEAKIMLGESGDSEINMVRNRAGLSGISGATMKDLKHERRVELAGEFANRHFDLVRWGDADAVYEKPLHGRNHAEKNNPDSDYTIIEVRAPRPQFDPNIHHVWRIPNRVIDNTGIEQNKGWN